MTRRTGYSIVLHLYKGNISGHLLTFSSVASGRDEQDEFRVKRTHKYCGASSFRDLKTFVLDSPMHNDRHTMQSVTSCNKSKYFKQMIASHLDSVHDS